LTQEIEAFDLNPCGIRRMILRPAGRSVARSGEHGAVVAHISPFLSSKEKAEKKEGGTPNRVSK
jgi:hypothetical protein